MHRNGEKYSYCYYICSNKRNRKTCDAKDIRKDQLEEYCLNQIKRHILDEEAMRVIAAQIANAAGTDADTMKADLSKFEKRREKIAAILKNIKKEQYEGEITKEMAEEMAAEYQHELLDIENRLCGLRTAVTSAVTTESVYLYLQELLSLYSANNDELTKMLFDKLVDSIIVHDNRVELSLIVIPFDGVRDKRPQGLPHYELSLQTTKEEIRR
jgi:site-specific DNA recombinase